jgi:hypothetical protein
VTPPDQRAPTREYVDALVAQSKQRLARILDLEDALGDVSEALSMTASIVRSGERMSQQADDQIHAALTKARGVIRGT